MEAEALKKALVDFLVEVVMEVKARAISRTQELQKPVSEAEVVPLDRSALAPHGPLKASMPRFISTGQAAQYWGTTTVAFRRMLERLFPELPKGVVVRVGKRVRVDMRAFENWLVAKEAGPRSNRG